MKEIGYVKVYTTTPLIVTLSYMFGFSYVRQNTDVNRVLDYFKNYLEKELAEPFDLRRLFYICSDIHLFPLSNCIEIWISLESYDEIITFRKRLKQHLEQ